MLVFDIFNITFSGASIPPLEPFHSTLVKNPWFRGSLSGTTPVKNEWTTNREDPHDSYQHVILTEDILCK